MFGLGSVQKTVVVIDDDPSLQRQVHFRLKKHEKLTVVQAINAETGLQKIQDSPPDLIVLDWVLPDISGPEVLKKLKTEQHLKDIPVLMLTGRNKVGDIEDAFTLGADAYLTKPLSLQKLGEKVTEILSKR